MIIGRPGCSVFSSCTCWRNAFSNTGIRSGPWRRPVSRIRAMEGNPMRTTRQPVPASRSPPADPRQPAGHRRRERAVDRGAGPMGQQHGDRRGTGTVD